MSISTALNRTLFEKKKQELMGFVINSRAEFALN